MFFSVIVMVVVLTFIASGYWINEDFEVERQGMLQVSSYPSGANVMIDGHSSWLQRTTTSKVLPVGEHTVAITKDGYDSWSKVINLSEGLLYRLQYPRLFPVERDTLAVYDATNTTLAFLSDNHEKLLLYQGDPTIFDLANFQIDLDSTADYKTILPEWTLIDLKAHDIESRPVTVRIISDFFQKTLDTDKDSLEDYAISDSLSGTEQLIFSKFYNDYYITVVNGPSIALYEKTSTEPVLESTLPFIPTDFHVGQEGEFIVFSSGNQLATLDMELLSIRKWSVDGENFGWLDRSMIYSVKDGELFVYDFDGYNRRVIAPNVSSRFPIGIVDDKWLYYFSDNNLIRESLIAS